MKRIALIFVVMIIMVSGFLFYINIPPDREDADFEERPSAIRSPVLIKGEIIFVSAKIVFNELGALTEWDEESNSYIATAGDFQIEVPLDEEDIIINNVKTNWHSPVIEKNNIIYIPIKDFAHTIETFAQWDVQARTLWLKVPSQFDPETGIDGNGPLLHVAYPPEGLFSYYGNKLFLFGTTQSYSIVDVTVNGEPVEILDSRTGNFLTMVDIPRGEEYPVIVKATGPSGETVVERRVIYPEWWDKMPRDPLAFHPSRLLPGENQVLKMGDKVQIAFQGSPGADAFFQIGSREDVYEMTERLYPAGPPGSGGVYTAEYVVSEDDIPEAGVTMPLDITVTMQRGDERLTRKLPGSLSFYAGNIYKVVRVKPENELKNSGWLYRLNEDQVNLLGSTLGGIGHPTSAIRYLVEGTDYNVTGRSGDFYKVDINGINTYLINSAVVNEIDLSYDTDISITELGFNETEEKIVIQLVSDGRYPFAIKDGLRSLEIELFGVLKSAQMNMPELVESTTRLDITEVDGSNRNGLKLVVEVDYNMAGFYPYWNDQGLVVELIKPMGNSNPDNPLAGKTIIVDPGHGGNDTGATGPGALNEKDVVLAMSLYLEDYLTREGANVIMTRTEDVFVNLYDRPENIDDYNADLFISVHANAHAHNAPATDVRGIMILYNYAHNEKLADIMLDTMVEETDLPRFRTWRRNIAVIRHPHVPSVLVEAGYMMHPDDNWYILHPRGQKEIARAMMLGIKRFFSED